MKLTVAQAVLRYLSAQFSERDGVRQRVVPGMFGIFGHGNVCGLGQALEEGGHSIAFFQPKNEQSMVHSAIGFAKERNRLATLACTASIGPGATNMLTGAAAATVNRIPVLLFPADTFATRLQGPPMQALDNADHGDVTVNDAFRPVSTFFDRITRPEQLLSVMPAAIRALLDPGRSGAVTVSIHQDTQAEAYDFPASFFAEKTWHVGRPRPDRGEVARAATAVAAAKRPFIIAGGGVRYAGAEDALKEFAEKHGIPVGETSAGKGVSVSCATSTGGVGHSGTKASNDLAKEADLVVAVGTRLIDLTTGSNSLFEDPGVSFVGINIASLDSHKLGAVSVVGDALESLAAIDEELSHRVSPPRDDWTRRRLGAKREWSTARSRDLGRDGTLTQSQVVKTLNSQFGADDRLVVASGTPHVDIHKLWDANSGGKVFMEVGFSCMGHEIPAALGVRLAAGQEGEVYAFIGDGTYLMGNSELVTAVQENVKITVLVVVNDGYQSIHALQRGKTGRSYGLEFRSRTDTGLDGDPVKVDYAGNAASYGCTTFVADSQEGLATALEEARRCDGPAVVVVRTDPSHLSIENGCWWDVGVASVSARPETVAAYEASETGRARQRWHG